MDQWEVGPTFRTKYPNLSEEMRTTLRQIIDQKKRRKEMELDRNLRMFETREECVADIINHPIQGRWAMANYLEETGFPLMANYIRWLYIRYPEYLPRYQPVIRPLGPQVESPIGQLTWERRHGIRADLYHRWVLHPEVDAGGGNGTFEDPVMADWRTLSAVHNSPNTLRAPYMFDVDYWPGSPTSPYVPLSWSSEDLCPVPEEIRLAAISLKESKGIPTRDDYHILGDMVETYGGPESAVRHLRGEVKTYGGWVQKYPCIKNCYVLKWLAGEGSGKKK